MTFNVKKLISLPLFLKTLNAFEFKCFLSRYNLDTPERITCTFILNLFFFLLSAATFLFWIKVDEGLGWEFNEQRFINQSFKLWSWTFPCFFDVLLCVVHMVVFIDKCVCVCLCVWERSKWGSNVFKLDMTHQVFHQCHLTNPTTLKCISCVCMCVTETAISW